MRLTQRQCVFSVQRDLVVNRFSLHVTGQSCININRLELEVSTKHGEEVDFLVGSSVLVRWYDRTDVLVQVLVLRALFLVRLVLQRSGLLRGLLQVVRLVEKTFRCRILAWQDSENSGPCETWARMMAEDTFLYV